MPAASRWRSPPASGGPVLRRSGSRRARRCTWRRSARRSGSRASISTPKPRSRRSTRRPSRNRPRRRRRAARSPPPWPPCRSRSTHASSARARMEIDTTTGQDPRLELFALVEAGDLEKVTRRLEDDPGLANARNEGGDSPLLVALYHGRRDLADLFLRTGAEVSLFEACVLGRRDLVDERLRRDPDLVRAHSHDGWTPLHLACFFGHTEVAGLLIARGADVNARDGSGFTPLGLAASNKNDLLVIRLLEVGAQVS